jgi:hypothetical protein
MNIAEFRPTKFITKEDCRSPLRLTIAAVEKKNLSRKITETDYRIIVSFEEGWRLTLNKSNLEAIPRLFGNETDDWTGNQISVHHDPTIEFEGEIVGGIRVGPASAVRSQAKKKREADEIPF